MDKDDLGLVDDDDFIEEDGVAYREVEIREQDRYLPVANIARIMKRVLPGNAKIAKDAKESIQACVSDFISFITQEASDKCQLEKRKTINGDDLLWAMGTLGFEQYGEPLREYLSKYRESVKGERPEKKNTSRDREKQAKAAAAAAAAVAGAGAGAGAATAAASTNVSTGGAAAATTSTTNTASTTTADASADKSAPATATSSSSQSGAAAVKEEQS
eukprot:GSChrysophyteH1.ASY1.ANO1.641.1 assembled CDS